MDLTESLFLLLALINPIGAIPFFISLTESQADEEKRHAIKVASISVAIVTDLSALLGEQIISFFGFSVGSLQVGGGIIIVTITLNTLNAQTSHAKATPEEEGEAGAEASIAVVPPTIPLLTGLDSVSTVIIYAGRTKYWWDLLLLTGVGVAIAAMIWIMSRAAEPIARMIGCTGINVSARLMGLILAVLTVGFIIDGLKALLPTPRA